MSNGHHMYDAAVDRNSFFCLCQQTNVRRDELYVQPVPGAQERREWWRLGASAGPRHRDSGYFAVKLEMIYIYVLSNSSTTKISPLFTNMPRVTLPKSLLQEHFDHGPHIHGRHPWYRPRNPASCFSMSCGPRGMAVVMPMFPIIIIFRVLVLRAFGFRIHNSC